MKRAFLVLWLSCGSLLYGQALIDSMPGPGPGVTGLAWDGSFLWVASTRRDSIFKLDPSTGVIVHGIGFDTEDDYGGLAWGEDSTIWVANRDSVFQLEPETGAVLAGFRAPGC